MSYEEEPKKILLLVGVIPSYTCKNSFSEQMLEYYLLKAKDALPDLRWEIKELRKNIESKPEGTDYNKG